MGVNKRRSWILVFVTAFILVGSAYLMNKSGSSSTSLEDAKIVEKDVVLEGNMRWVRAGSTHRKVIETRNKTVNVYGGGPNLKEGSKAVRVRGDIVSYGYTESVGSGFQTVGVKGINIKEYKKLD